MGHREEAPEGLPQAPRPVAAGGQEPLHQDCPGPAHLWSYLLLGQGTSVMFREIICLYSAVVLSDLT